MSILIFKKELTKINELTIFKSSLFIHIFYEYFVWILKYSLDF